MEDNQKQRINENSTFGTNAYPNSVGVSKKSSVKINGQISSNESEKHETPRIPAKPVRHTIAFKDGRNAMAHLEHDQANGKAAPVANTAETDEIEFLLDEIRDLEAPACRTDSEQDFEIAGSRVDLDLSLRLDSPIDTSWYYFSIIV